MIATVLITAGLDPSYLIGAGLNDIGSNARSGSGDLVVAESDESDGSFLLLQPTLGVVTNVELDHVDHWGTIDDLYKAFEIFMRAVPADGTLVLPSGDERLLAHARGLQPRTVTFGPDGDVYARDIESEGTGVRFSLVSDNGSTDVSLSVPGQHNVVNALATAAACRGLGLDLAAIAGGLGAYRGVERRFQMKGSAAGVTVVDDYAHHPTEVKATLEAARGGGYARVVAVFQPHRYSRTAALAGAFGESFSNADRIVLTDVYGAGEDPVPGVSGKLIADALTERLPGRPVAYFPHRSELLSYLMATSRPGDLLLTMGAGDVTGIGDELLAGLETST